MSIFTDIISTFSKVNKYYNFASSVWKAVETEVPKLSKSFYCDTFTPNQTTIVNALKTSNPEIYKKYKSFIDVQESKSILSNVKLKTDNLEKSLEIEYNIKVSDFLKPLEPLETLTPSKSFTSSEILETLTVLDPCINFETPIDTKELKFSKPEVSEKLQELIDKCKKSDEFSDKPFENPKDFTPKELEEIVCDIQKDDRFQETLTSLEEFTTNTKPKEFSKTTTVEDPEQNFQNDLPLLQEFLKNEYPCFNILLKKTEELSNKSNKYIEVLSNQAKIEKDWVYSQIIYNFYTEVESFIKNPTSASSVANLTIPKALLNISNEFKASEVQDFYNIQIAPKSPKDLKGQYFDIDKNISKKVKSLIDSKSYKELEDIKKERDKNFQKNVKKLLNDFHRAIISHNQGLLNFYRIFAESEIQKGNISKYTFTDFTKQGMINTIIKFELSKNLTFIQNNLSKAKKSFDKSKKAYDEFLKLSEKFKKELEEGIKQYEKDLKELPCKDEQREFTTVDLEEPKDGDFRGLNDIKKPSYYDEEYWKRFAKLATIVGLFPIPQFTISNDIKINLTDFTNPQISLPSGSIAIDDDGIPRFLFYPIGLVIPTILSADFIYRIPIPIIWKFLSLKKIESPVKKLTEKLISIQNDISEFSLIKDYYNSNIPYSDVLQQMKDGSIENFIRILGIDKELNVSNFKNFIISKTNKSVSNFQKEFYETLKPVENDKEKAIVFLQTKTDEVSKYLETYTNNIVNDIQTYIDARINSINLDKYKNILDSKVNDIGNVLNAIEDVLKLFQNCSGVNVTSLINFKRDFDEYINSFKKYSDIEIPFGFEFPRLKIPNIRLKDYLDLSLDKLSLGFEEFFKGFTKGISDFFLMIEKYIWKYFYKVMKFVLFKFDLNPLKLGIKIPKDLINSLVISNYNIPELLLVAFLGISGIFPYPFILAINPTNTDIPLIPARTIEFLLTLDYRNPIKKIKKNFGSYCLPLPTLIDGTLNATLGYVGDLLKPDNTGKFDIDLCALTGKFKEFEWLKKPITFKSFVPSLKDLYNMFETPNPFVLCKLSKAQNVKDALDIALKELQINKNLLPSKIQKLRGFTNFSLTDLDGNVLIDEFKKNFNVNAIPKLSDFVSLSKQAKMDYYKAEVGMSKKVVFDTFPELSKWSPYLQDDLPSWERLNLGNIPFVFFLIEFCIAGKKGAKFPIPEILPYLEM